jgi:hypothetical protein
LTKLESAPRTKPEVGGAYPPKAYTGVRSALDGLWRGQVETENDNRSNPLYAGQVGGSYTPATHSAAERSPMYGGERMTIADAATGWVAVARETFEYNMLPWMGRQYEPWLRAWARPHPLDPHRQVLVPERLYGVFKNGHVPFQRVTPQQLAAAGYPEVPGERELEFARRELRQAVLRGEWQCIPSLHSEIEELEEQVAATRQMLRRRSRTGYVPVTRRERVGRAPDDIRSRPPEYGQPTLRQAAA